MRAVVCNSFQAVPDLAFVRDRPVPAPADEEVLLEVRAVGVGFPDVLLMQGAYQVRQAPPFVVGTECVGIVAGVGRAVREFAVGDRVVCNSFDGVLADYAVVHRSTLVAAPRTLTDEEAAIVPINYFTVYHALKQRARLAPGETMLVLGAAGGTGSVAVQLGKRMGARVIAAASSAAKLDFARDLGADELVNYTDENLKARVKELTGGRGVDVVFDPVGSVITEAAVRTTAYLGRYLVIGFAAGEIPRIPLNLALLKACSLVGVYLRQFTDNDPEGQAANVRDLWRMFESEGLRPVVGPVHDLEDYRAALGGIIERRVVGKTVLRVRAASTPTVSARRPDSPVRPAPEGYPASGCRDVSYCAASKVNA